MRKEGRLSGPCPQTAHAFCWPSVLSLQHTSRCSCGVENSKRPLPEAEDKHRRIADSIGAGAAIRKHIDESDEDEQRRCITGLEAWIKKCEMDKLWEDAARAARGARPLASSASPPASLDRKRPSYPLRHVPQPLEHRTHPNEGAGNRARHYYKQRSQRRKRPPATRNRTPSRPLRVWSKVVSPVWLLICHTCAAGPDLSCLRCLTHHTRAAPSSPTCARQTCGAASCQRLRRSWLRKQSSQQDRMRKPPPPHAAPLRKMGCLPWPHV